MESGSVDVYKDLVGQMKKMVEYSMNSVKSSLMM
jgi:hypothetical protein